MVLCGVSFLALRKLTARALFFIRLQRKSSAVSILNMFKALARRVHVPLMLSGERAICAVFRVGRSWHVCGIYFAEF